MKTRCFLLILAAIGAFALRMSGQPQLDPLYSSTPKFDLPKEVVEVTTPKNLPPSLTQSVGYSYEEMKSLVAMTKYGFAFSFKNNLSGPVVYVINGKLLTYRSKDGSENARVTPPSGEAVMPYTLFRDHGDTLIIGVFKLEKGNQLKFGSLHAVRFGDLFDADGNLRRMTISVDHARPASRMVIAHNRPNLRDKTSVVKMKTQAPNMGPVVMMETMKVSSSRDWLSFEPIRRGDVIVALKVTSVLPGKPYAEAGVKAGMILRPLGFSKPHELDSKGSWDQGDIIFEAWDPVGSVWRKIVISEKAIQKAVSARTKDVVAAVAP